MKSLRPLAALLAFATLGAGMSGPSIAQEPKPPLTIRTDPAQPVVQPVQAGGYSVYPMAQQNMCGAVRNWQHDDLGAINLMLLDFVGTDMLGLSVTLERLPHELPEGNLPISIYLVDNGKTKLDTGWGTRTFRHARSETKAFVVGNFLPDERTRFLQDLASSSALAFYHGDDLIAAFPLDGIAEATAQLDTCTDTLAMSEGAE